MTALVSAVNRWLSKRVVRDAGFTLVEVIISVSLLGLITGAATSSMLTATSAARSTSQSSHESTDAQLISAFLVRDAQAAGGSRPSTGTADPDLGVSKTDDAGCTPSGSTLKLRFKWYDRFSPPTDTPTPVYFTNVVTYGLNGSHELVRHSCVDGAPKGDLILGTNVQSVTAGCIPVADCSVLPDIVTLSVTETNSPGYSATPFTFNLQAQVRSESQAAPSTASAGAVPLLALGGGPCPSSGAYLSISGNSDLKVELGGAIVNAADSTSPLCKAMKISGSPTYTADSTSILSGGTCVSAGGVTCPDATSFPTKLVDPLADLLPPTASPPCSPVGPNPAPAASGHYVAGTYRQPVTLNSSDVFDDGVYIFCQGLKITGKLDAPHVMLFFAGGTLEMAGNSEVSIGTIPLPSLYSNVAIWVPKTNPATDLEIRGGTGINSYKGIIYAPNATLTVSGGAQISIGSVIARAINLIGTGQETFGPGITITTPFLQTAGQGLSYNFAMSVDGGRTPYSGWSATGLAAAGLSMTTAGVITGTPTVLGTYPITFSISDSSTPSRTTSRTYDLIVSNSAITISTLTVKPATLLNNYSERITATGGSGVYTSWALQAGDSLPAGLSFGAPGIDYIDIVGTPTGPTGDTTFTLKVLDSLGFPAQRMFTLTVNYPPAIGFPLSLPDTTAGASYLALSSVTGGSGTLTWTIANQPAGLVIVSATGLLSGTLASTTAGDYSVRITVTDINGAAAIKTLPLKVNVAPSITAPAGLTLPGWAVGAAYPSTTMTATGGTGSYRWSAVGLPGSLSMSLGGVITGTPITAVANASVAVTVTDSVNVSVTRNYSITITGPLSITAPTSLPNWDAGAAYPSTTPTVGGGSGGYVWSSSTLPSGLVINSSTGEITGTPTNPGPYAGVMLRVTDSNGVVATKPYSMRVYAPLAFTGPGSLPNWAAGTLYPTQTFTVSGGSGSNTWSATGLPPGLSLSPAGVLSGTPSPTSPATYSAIFVSVGDGAGGGFNIGPYTITVHPALGINTGGVPSVGFVGTAYNGSLSATGGSGNYSWSASGLPAGVILSAAGALSGSPTTGATYTANFTLTDAGTGGIGGPPASITVPFTIKTYQPLGWGTLPTPPAAWTAGFAYPSQTFPTSGGLPSIVWSASGLPLGMSINTGNGVISGTPTAVGASTVTVTAKDALNQTITTTFSLNVNPAIAVSGLSGSVIRGVAYSSTVTATGGTGTLTWTASNLPPGLTFDPNTRTLSGIVNRSGSWNVTVTATDLVGATGSQTVTLLIRPTITSVAFVNGGNAAAAGKMEKGDSIIITFSDDISASTLCSAWVGTSSNVLVSLNDGTTANDTISFTADGTGCAPSIGTFDLGGTGFATTGGPVVFGGANGNGGRSTIVLSTTTTPAPIKSTLTITLGTASPTNGNGMGSFSGVTANALYNPNTSISDPRGAFITGTATIAPTANKFF